ncbi:MAG: cation:proton antiporter [Methanomassiliicoccus sp.]|nr:cation:proton antiporter [Methanomassiliicoccus sp.]
MDAETRLILDIALLLSATGLLSLVLGRLRLPAIIGYLAGGLVLGSSIIPGFQMEEATLEVFSTIGIILLMFFIGIELNLKGLRKTGPAAFLIVSIEMTMMVIIGYYLGRLIGLDDVQSIFIGAIISGASTAAVLMVAKENLHMRGDLSIMVMSLMVFEDIAQIIILTLASPLAAGTGSSDNVYWVVLEIVAFMGLTILIGLAVMPRAMDWLRRNYNKETILIISLAFCFALAFISGYVGLSIAIGAFLAGIIISESSCNNIVRRRIEPMKEVFIAIFFFAIGMRIDIGMILDNILLCFIIAFVFIIGKLSSIFFASYLTTMGLRSSFYLASSLVVMGEFGFIIATLGLNGGILDLSMYSTVIGAALITMVVLPLLSRSGPRIFDFGSRNAPSFVRNVVQRMERVRGEVRRKMAISPELRLEVRGQLLMVFVDMVLIITIILVLNLLDPIREALTPLAGDLHILPSLLLFVTSIVLISPVVVNVITRLRLIALIIMMNVSEGGRQTVAGRMRIYRLFRNVGGFIVIMVLMLLILPLLPQVSTFDETALLALTVIIVLLSVLSWGVLRPAFGKISQGVVARIVLMDEVTDEQPGEIIVCDE